MTSHPRANEYRRLAALVTTAPLLAPSEKAEQLEVATRAPLWRRKDAQARVRALEAEWRAAEDRAADDAIALAESFEATARELARALQVLHDSSPVHVQGVVADERGALVRVQTRLAEARASVEALDFAAAGKAITDADRILWSFGAPLVAALNEELRTSAYSRETHAALIANQERRRAARREAEIVRKNKGGPDGLAAGAVAYNLMAQSLEMIAGILAHQDDAAQAAPSETRRDSNAVRVVQPQDLETLQDVGGLDDVKENLRRTLAVHLERADGADEYGAGQNSVLLYGPPGTGKTLLARAVAGEFGLRFIRVTPSSIASPYAHETARNLGRVFATARQNTPALLFIDEIDSLASARSSLPSAEAREVVTQLLSLLDEHAGARGLVVMGATNAIDLLDTALREGRFDVRIPVPMPDATAREGILDVHLQARTKAVDWKRVELEDVVARTAGYSGAGLAALVRVAAEHALAGKTKITTANLLAAIEDRQARDRTTLEEAVHWDDVVLPASLRERLQQLMELVQHPEMAEGVGIRPPAGILLYGPPGTGKTTIAKALATEVRASFYEMSAADLLSKWVGESEQKVQKLFETARNSRPSIIFIDEIDALLRRRSANSSSPWEERVVSQFLRELDGLQAATGVFLVGATNRLDIIDEAIRERRLTSLEVPLPDLAGRELLLGKLFERVKLAADVDLAEFARATGGCSGADLKRLRDEVGMKALSRGLKEGRTARQLVITAADFYESFEESRVAVIPD